MSKALLKKVEELEHIASSRNNTHTHLNYGIVCPENGHIRTINYQAGKWVEVNGQPDIEIPAKLEPVLTRPKRFIVVVGGRGSGKSQNIGAIEMARIFELGIKVGCFREFQNSIEDSVFSLLKNQAVKFGFEGFTYPNNSVINSNGGAAKFRGLARNPDSVKSMDGFKDFWTEEAQATSENSLKLLTPTMRTEGGRLIFTANPGSSEDAFSKRFIVPFQDELERNGIYEDDLHLVIVMNWRDNPWFPQELDQERLWDHNNLPRALYDHIWEGKFNDSVDNSIIPAEWFDACIDAHVKLNFKELGAKIVSHDPSDVGNDPKGLCLRHGSVILDVMEKTDGDGNEGMDWALDFAINNGADYFVWDCDGLGATLKRQVTQSLDGKKIEAVMFKGSESPYNPESLYDAEHKAIIREQRKIKEIYRNKRSQCYSRLQDRVYATYRAVVHGDYVNPDDMISFSSNIKHLSKLRSEVCRLPLKENGNGFYQIMTKKEMASHKPPIPSPNMADSVMMSLADFQVIIKEVEPVIIPKTSYW
jgi:phage terminase large subunit